MLHCCIVRKQYAVRLVVVSGLLLILDLFLAPWYIQTFLIANIEFTRTALEPPNGWAAVLAWLSATALLVEVVLSRVAVSGLPEMPLARAGSGSCSPVHSHTACGRPPASPAWKIFGSGAASP